MLTRNQIQNYYRQNTVTLPVTPVAPTNLEPILADVITCIRLELNRLPDSYFGYSEPSRLKLLINDYINERSNRVEAVRASQRDKANKRRKALEKEREPKIRSWIENNLKVGDIIHVKGTRDGLGLREVKNIWTPNYSDARPTIECYQLKTSRPKGTVERTGYETSHDFAKLRSVKINGKDTLITTLI